MRLTEAASEMIVSVMRARKLDPEIHFLEINILDNGALGMAFCRNRHGQVFEFGDLTVIVEQQIDTSGVVVDFGEVNGRMGLIFLGEENVSNQIDRESVTGSEESDGRTEDES